MVFGEFGPPEGDEFANQPVDLMRRALKKAARSPDWVVDIGIGTSADMDQFVSIGRRPGDPVMCRLVVLHGADIATSGRQLFERKASLFGVGAKIKDFPDVLADHADDDHRFVDHRRGDNAAPMPGHAGPESFGGFDRLAISGSILKREASRGHIDVDLEHVKAVPQQRLSHRRAADVPRADKQNVDNPA